MTELYPQDPTPDTPEGLPDVPTQIAYPLRAIVRTIVQQLVGLLLAWLARQGIEVATDPDVSRYLVDVATAVVWLAGTTLATWVMTRPAVARILAQTALSPVPRRAA